MSSDKYQKLDLVATILLKLPSPEGDKARDLLLKEMEDILSN